MINKMKLFRGSGWGIHTDYESWLEALNYPVNIVSVTFQQPPAHGSDSMMAVIYTEPHDG